MRTNVKTPTPPIFTHEGAKAVKIGPVEQLRRSVMANMLFEGTFYEDGEDIAIRIRKEVLAVLKLKDGADTVANIAYEARTKFKLRHAPLWIALALVTADTPETRKVVAGMLAHVIQRPDEMAEFVSMYWKVNGVAGGKNKMLPKQVKKGLALCFQKFNEYSLSKYANREGDVKMRDVLFLTHPKPTDLSKSEPLVKLELGTGHYKKRFRHDNPQGRLWRSIAEKTVKVPENTWEVALSAGGDKKEVFTNLLKENALGSLALLRNLRNMQQSGVDRGLIKSALGTMKTERVLPFRFITAARYAPDLEPQLEEAMFRCLTGMPQLPGKTVLVVDHSGSMGHPISAKSELTRFQAAAALAILIREICEEVDVLTFSSATKLVPPRRGFALRDAMANSNDWGGTNTGLAVLTAKHRGYDRIIVLTDEQSHTQVEAPVKGSKGYFINVASNKNGIGYGPWLHLDGWSEAIVEYIIQHEGIADIGADNLEAE